MTQSYKACPKCQTPTPLTEANCRSCGHAFRTQFVPPDQTQMLPPSYPPSYPQHVPNAMVYPFAPLIRNSSSSWKRIFWRVALGMGVASILMVVFLVTWIHIAPPPFEGTWMMKSGRSTLGFMFNRDGTGEKFYELTDYEPGTVQPSGHKAFRWTRDGNFLLLKYNEDKTPIRNPIPGLESEITPVAWLVSEGGNVLTLQNNSLTFTFYREGRIR